MKLTSLHDLLIHELQDLCSAEEQLTSALPKMAKAAKNEDLKAAIEEHLEVTQSQLERVTELLEQLESKPGRSKCAGMAGIIKEGSDVIAEKGIEPVKDAALISAAQRVEHYEMAGYGTARTLAQLLGLDDAAAVLEEILEEEKEADEKLSAIAEDVNAQALEMSSADDDEEEQDDQDQSNSSSKSRSSASRRTAASGRKSRK